MLRDQTLPIGESVGHRVTYTLNPPDQAAEWNFSAWNSVGTALLLINDEHERWLYTNGDDTLTPSPFLVPEPAVAIGYLAGAARIVGESGEIYASTTLLGPLSVSHGFGGPVRSAAIGRRAMVVIDHDGRLHRSTDLEHWVSVALLSPEPPFRVILAPNGTGLVMTEHEIHSTADDGATWKREFFPVTQLTLLENDDDGTAIVVRQNEGRKVRFSGSPPALGKATSMYADSVRKPLQHPLKELHSTHTHCGIALDHQRVIGDAVVFETKKLRKAGWSTSIHRIGEAVQLWQPSALKCAKESYGTAIAAWGKSFASVCWSPTESTHESQAWVSDDGGASFHTEWLDLHLENVASVVLGPSGFMIARAFCNPEREPCVPDVLRMSAGQPFVPASWDPNGLIAATFAESRARAFVVATKGADLRLFRSEGGSKFVAIGKPLRPSSGVSSLSVTLTPSGELVVAACSGTCKVFRTKDDGQHWQRSDAPGVEIHLAGNRGLASPPYIAPENEPRVGFETKDAGATWAAVPLPEDFSRFDCTDAGCVSPRGERRGWEL